MDDRTSVTNGGLETGHSDQPMGQPDTAPAASEPIVQVAQLDTDAPVDDLPLATDAPPAGPPTVTAPETAVSDEPESDTAQTETTPTGAPETLPAALGDALADLGLTLEDALQLAIDAEELEKLFVKLG